MSYDHKTATTKYIFKMMDKLFISPDGVKRVKLSEVFAQKEQHKLTQA